jgi:hypothetical protein
MSFEIEHIFIIVVATYYTISFKNMSDTEFGVLFTLFASLLFIIVNKSSFDEWKQNTITTLSKEVYHFRLGQLVLSKEWNNMQRYACIALLS